jgi:protoporphyrinogen/coproporphyrinogen III oxidase
VSVESIDTLVIGGGISGLTYAHARGPRADLVLCEAAPRAGGLVHTEHAGIEGARFELGPEALQTGSAAVRALLDELALPLQSAAPAATRRYLVHAGRLHEVPTGPAGLLRTPLLSAAGKLRLLSEPWRDALRALDGSIADFARHRLGGEALAALVEPVIGGIHAGDSAALSLRACFPEVATMVEEHGSLLRALRARRGGERASLVRPSGGMAALTDALAASLGPRLRLSAPVEALEATRSGWRARTPSGVLQARRVVVALPAAAAGRLLADCAPRIAAAAREVHSESLASLAFSYPRERVAHALDGFGYLAAPREGARHLGTLFSSSIDPSVCASGRVLLRTLVGGALRPELVDAPQEELWDIVRREVAPLLGLEGEPAGRHLTRWRAVLPRYDLNHPSRVEGAERAAAALPGLALLGNWLRGIGLAALIAAARERARADG